MTDTPVQEQDELDAIHWGVVKGKRAIRAHQIDGIVRQALEAGDLEHRSLFPSELDESRKYRRELFAEQKDDAAIELLRLGEQQRLRSLRQQETELLRKASKGRKHTYRHFVMTCLGIDAEEFESFHRNALMELNRSEWCAKVRRNEEGVKSCQAAFLQIRSIQRRVVEEWESARRDEVNKSSDSLIKEWKRRKKRPKKSSSWWCF